jgi:glycosyltransferase 2 family protein
VKRPTDGGNPVKRRQTVTLVVRIGVSVAMLTFLLTRIPSVRIADMVPAWTLRTATWLGAAMVLTLVAFVLSVLRWQKVLDALGMHSKLRPLLSHYLAGQFVSNVLPTTIGGDVLRVSRLSRETGESPGPFASVVLERLTGWLVLPIITFVGFVVNPRLTDLGTASAVALGLSAATLVGLVLLLIAVADRRIGGRFDNRDGWRRFAGAVHLGVTRLRRHPGAALNVLLVGFAYQLALVLAALAAAQALGIRPAGLTFLLAFFPAVAIAQVLPIGISGLGVREGAFVLFLTPLGVAAPDAIALGLLLYFLNLGVSLLGAPAFAVGGQRRGQVEPVEPPVATV